MSDPTLPTVSPVSDHSRPRSEPTCLASSPIPDISDAPSDILLHDNASNEVEEPITMSDWEAEADEVRWENSQKSRESSHEQPEESVERILDFDEDVVRREREREFIAPECFPEEEEAGRLPTPPPPRPKKSTKTMNIMPNILEKGSSSALEKGGNQTRKRRESSPGPPDEGSPSRGRPSITVRPL